MSRIHLAILAALALSLPLAAFAGPCTDGGYGSITDPSGSVHVSPTGDDAAAGTEAAPFKTLAQALTQSRATGKHIALHTGTWFESLSLSSADDGLTIAGCSSTESRLSGGSSTSLISASGTDSFLLAGIGLSGGKNSLNLTDGATATTDEIAVVNAWQTAVRISGSGSELMFKNSNVERTRDVSGVGAAILVDGGFLDLKGGTVTKNKGNTIEIKGGGDASLRLATISDALLTATGAGGHALVADSSSTFDMRDYSIEDTADAAIVAPDAANAWLENISVDVPDTGLEDEDHVVVHSSATVINVTVNGTAI